MVIGIGVCHICHRMMGRQTVVRHIEAMLLMKISCQVV